MCLPPPYSASGGSVFFSLTLPFVSKNMYKTHHEVVLTFMEKPFIDFKFKLGKLNVMSIGPGDMNVGALVSETIKNIVTNLMVFPVKMVIPILYEQDILVSWLGARPLPFCRDVYVDDVFPSRMKH